MFYSLSLQIVATSLVYIYPPQLLSIPDPEFDPSPTCRSFSLPTLHSGLPERMGDSQLRMLVVCGFVAVANFFLFCACGLSLLRVLKVAARDAYSSPRRRLLALDDGVPRRIPGRVMAVLGGFRPFTTQKALISMSMLSSARECRFWVLPWVQA